MWFTKEFFHRFVCYVDDKSILLQGTHLISLNVAADKDIIKVCNGSDSNKKFLYVEQYDLLNELFSQTT